MNDQNLLMACMHAVTIEDVDTIFLELTCWQVTILSDAGKLSLLLNFEQAVNEEKQA